jgi:uncharacterized membrane-anchored protein YitT (DUF2179 family)
MFISALFLTLSIQSFVLPSNMISGGFTGVALLLNTLTKDTSFVLDTSVMLIVLNLPVAYLCYKSISKRFTILSVCQIILTSVFLKIFHFQPFVEDIILNSIFGGIFYGLAVVIALKADLSTGGTDFIALYFSNRFNKSLWTQVFMFNTILIIILGVIQGWKYAGYSIIFQFVATKIIDTLHTRYHRLTLEIITQKPDDIIAAYIEYTRHGMTCHKGYGGYSKQEITVIHTVLSSYELNETKRLLKKADDKVVINIFKTEEFVGAFYQKPIA